MKKHYMNEHTRDFLQSREKPRVTQNRDIDWWIRQVGARFEYGILLCMLAFVVFVGVYLFKKQQPSSIFPLSDVVIVGETHFTTRDDVEKALGEALPKSFVDIDTNDVRDLIMTLPWVLDVQVTKHWPGTLKVSVTEREPVMRWGEDRVVDDAGVVFKASHDPNVMASLMNKPILIGPDEKAFDVLINFETMAKAFPKYAKLKPKSFEYTTHKSWNLNLDNGAVIHFGTKFLEPRSKRLAVAYRQKLLPEMDKVDAIFLMYNQGLSVQWKSEDGNGQGEKPKLVPVVLESI